VRYILGAYQGDRNLHPADGSDMLLRNVGCYKNHTTSHHRRQHGDRSEALSSYEARNVGDEIISLKEL
jgi:hypothetical protein